MSDASLDFLRGGPVLLRPGVALACSAWGRQGPRVLLLHGIPGAACTFEAVSARLAPDCHVVAVDLWGFGASSPAPAGTHAQAQAEVLALLVDRLPGDWHLVGFDFGGPTAVLLAALRPGRFRSLTLLATNLFPDTPVPLPLRVASVPGLGRLFFRLAFGWLGLAAMWLAAVADRAAFPFARYRRALGAQGVRSTRDVFFHSMVALRALYEPVERAARGLGLPAQVLWGTRDPFFPVAVGRRTAEAVRAELELLPGCGHFVPEERPDEVARAIRALALRTEVRSR